MTAKARCPVPPCGPGDAGPRSLARLRSSLPTWVLALALAVTSGCSAGPAVEKGGAPRTVAVVIGHHDRAANPDGQTYGGPAFVSALGAASQQALVATARTVTGTSPTQLLEQVRTGDLAGAWVAARDLEAAGLGRFGPVSAPLLLANQEAQAELTEPVNAEPFLESLRGSGLTGLALMSGALRRPIAASAPLLGPESWADRKVRALSPTQGQTIAALGATPVARLQGMNAGLQGTFDAGETDVASQFIEGETTVAPYVTANVVLWPKLWVLVVGTTWFEGLDDQQREWVREAAQTARTASVEGDHHETEAVRALCDQGARFPAATQADVAAIRDAVEPVLTALAADPVDGPLLEIVRAVSERNPGVTELEVPRFCRTPASPRDRVESVPTTRSAIPPGTYRMDLTAQDIADAGSGKTRDEQVVTLIIGEDGSYSSSSQFKDNGSSMVFEAGEVFGDGDMAYFVNDLDRLKALATSGESACVWADPSLGCLTNTEPYSVRWATGPNGSLSLSEVRGVNPDPVIVLSLVAKPYQRVR